MFWLKGWPCDGRATLALLFPIVRGARLACDSCTSGALFGSSILGAVMARAMRRPAAASGIVKKTICKKRPAAAFNPFTAPKRGDGRVQGRRGPENGDVSYVRTDEGATKTRKERQRWCRTIDSFTTDTDAELVDLLIEDGILFDWSGLTCPFCGKGTLGDRYIKQWASGSGYEWRCNDGRKCGKQVRPTHCHPIFAEGNGKETSTLKDKARVLFGILTGMTTAQIYLHYVKNHKMIEDMTRNLDLARKQYVEKYEKDIVYGDGKKWVDVEADESVFATALTEDKRAKEWGQWAGVAQRGKPATLVLFKTESDRTAKNAPGPGAIKKSDWKPFLLGRLKDRKVVLHSGGARSYKMKAPGLLHDAAIHCKKRVKRGGKWVWIKPVYSKIVKHKLPSGNVLKVKSGTQIIDRAWKHVKNHIGPRAYKPHSRGLAARVRSAQWEYWHRGKDPWAATGAMVRDLMGSTF